MSAPEAVGVDLGGTKMLVGVLGSGMQIVHRNLAPSQVGSQEALLALLLSELRAAIAARPDVAALPDFRQRLDCVSRILFARPPTAEETALAQAFFGEQTSQPELWQRYVQALLMTNEFVFVD